MNSPSESRVVGAHRAPRRNCCNLWHQVSICTGKGMAAIQLPDGSFPQNSWLNGEAYWKGLQLDEIAAPILLSWRLRREGAALGLFDPTVMILRAARYLILQGPVTGQERWEENSGYSPSTLATVIAGLVCAADFIDHRNRAGTAEFILAY